MALGISACTPEEDPILNLGSGLPDQVYQPVPLYDGPINTVGTLTEGYITNTEGLITANGRLDLLCQAYRVCPQNNDIVK